MKKYLKEILRRFEESMPIPKTELNYRTPFELLVAVILSAQCTDKRVNQITPALFERFPIPELMAKASFEEVFELIKSCSYPNNKAKHLIAMSQKLLAEYNSEIPDTMENLTSLPGVGRKTANVILSIVHKKPAIAVDTHVFRVAKRLGFASMDDSFLETEKSLMKQIPEQQWGDAHHWLILHGRYVCKAQKPKCSECFLKDICPHEPKNL